ncbi:hypothetical protein [Halioxenophilus aromaticivorans]|uniref:Uncharacterized protein n=1 Tax=Halioxenophilus aromaticivorans TaxID=1306992 RepID=A0AAV3TY16_9ALTE
MQSGWTILIIVLVIAMAVGPVMLMQPSGRQRRLAKLRQQAANQGLTVSTGGWPSKAGKRPTGAMRYSLPWAADDRHHDKLLLVKKDYQHELHVAGCWQLYSDQDQVRPSTEQFLQSANLPAGVYAMGFDGLGAFVDWSEDRSEDLTAVAEFLLALRASVSG